MRSSIWKLACSSVAAATFAFVSACSSDSASTNSLGSCPEGQQVSCPCVGGTTSTATCSNGRFGSCACGVNATMDSGGGGMDATAIVPADTGAPDVTPTPDTGVSDSGDAGPMEAGKDAGDASIPGVDYGKPCAIDGDCAPPYPTCQKVQQQMICTKSCSTNLDCPSPPTSGQCNANGYCK